MWRESKAENSHQKMHVTVGPWGIGVELAHYLQVILAYQYTVNDDILGCGWPDFGQTELHLEVESNTESWTFETFISSQITSMSVNMSLLFLWQLV